CHMGVTAEEIAKRHSISRCDQDAFAAESQRRAVDAAAAGRFTAEIVPVEVPARRGASTRVSADEYPRPGTTVEKLSQLKPAFAAQSLAVVRELNLDPAKVNVNGGAIALGHPIGASGARILTTLIYELKARGGRYGVATLCIGGGMGIAMAIEVL